MSCFRVLPRRSAVHLPLSSAEHLPWYRIAVESRASSAHIEGAPRPVTRPEPQGASDTRLPRGTTMPSTSAPRPEARELDASAPARAAAPAPELTLDPQDWGELRDLGHRMVDDMLEWLRTVRERPAWQPMPPDARAAFDAPAPRRPAGAEAAYRAFVEQVLPYPMGNVHPRFWGWVIGTGTPFGAMADMLAATINPNVGGGQHAAPFVEAQVVAWCKEMLGYPAEASGLLVSGGSMANLVGLAVARSWGAERLGVDVRRAGVRGTAAPMVAYTSREAHSSVQKAMELLGLGSDALRKLPVHADFTLDVAALERAIADDRAAGLHPFCVIGNAGTVNTGAVDDLPALADLCAREGLWFHVDGAFGALAALAPDALADAERARLSALARADSLAFDLHKWMYMPYDVGCALVRHPDLHHGTFALTPDYLARVEGGLASDARWLSEYGVELSRGFRALKVWLSLQEHGIDRYAQLVAQNLAQAAHLARLVDDAPDLERLSPTSLNIVCFRWRGSGANGAPLDDATLDDVNRRLLVALQERGIAVPSNTVVNGRFALRVAIVNHRTTREDLELFVDEVRRIGAELASDE